MKKILVLVFSLFLAACGGGSSDTPAAAIGSLEIYRPMALAGSAGQVTGAFMSLRNTGAQADRLLGASSDVAETIQVHETVVENEVMSMREVPALELPPGQTVELKHGSYHLMLINLKADLKAGETITLRLKFERAGEVTVSVPVRAR